jgi:flagellar hook-associated protein 2
VDKYNSTVDRIRGKLNEAPVVNPQTAGDQLKGDLYGDSMLDGLLSQMRIAIYSPVNTGNSDLDEMSELGISTGEAVGSGTLNQDAIAGKLTFDQDKFMEAAQSDPDAARKLLSGDSSGPGFAQAFDDLLAPAVAAQGTIDQTISSADDEYRQLSDQLSSMDELLQQKQDMLKKQFADMETAIQQSQAAASQVSGQLAQLSG